jgi:hypothetical protein
VLIGNQGNSQCRFGLNKLLVRMWGRVESHEDCRCFYVPKAGCEGWRRGFFETYLRATEFSGLHASFQPRVFALHGDDELDFAGALLLLEIAGFLADELLKGIQR